jgi:acetylornithine aminotransferase/acetylornithine/N-succinyldiaminopimelate aminotransferase
LGCAAALAVLDVFDRESVLENVKTNGIYMIDKLEKLSHEYPEKMKDVRGRGFMIGLEMTGDPTPVVTALREAGLLVPAAGGNVVRLLPPLIASRKEIDEAITLISTVLEKLNLK